jgi:hypothetical protein
VADSNRITFFSVYYLKEVLTLREAARAICELTMGNPSDGSVEAWIEELIKASKASELAATIPAPMVNQPWDQAVIFNVESPERWTVCKEELQRWWRKITGENLFATESVAAIVEQSAEDDERADRIQTELLPVLEDMRNANMKITPKPVMKKLQARAVTHKNSTCIVRVVAAGVVWMDEKQDEHELNVRNLAKRIDRWKKKSPRDTR